MIEGYVKSCKGCGEQVQYRAVDDRGFCQKGICQLKSEGYKVGFNEAVEKYQAYLRSAYQSTGNYMTWGASQSPYGTGCATDSLSSALGGLF